MENEHYDEFIRQFNESKIAYEFRQLILNNEPLKGNLYDEFINTEKVPSLRLFSQQYVSDEEWSDSRLNGMFSEDPAVRKKARDVEKRLEEAIDEFYKLKSNGTIDKSFYSYDIKATNLIRIFYEIEVKLEIFKKITINNNNYSRHANDAEVYASSIVFILNKLDNQLWIEKVAEAIMEDNDNYHAHGSLLGDKKEWESYLVLKEHFNFRLRNALPGLLKGKILAIDGKAKKTKRKPQTIKDIWLGTENEFWRIVKTYANDYVQEVDGRAVWTDKNSGITYLAGFTYECQQKGWIRKNAFSAPEFKVVYQDTFNITFDPKPFKQGNLETISDQYRKPFKGIQHRTKN